MSLKECIKTITAERWNIGFIQNSLDGIVKGDDIDVRWINHKSKQSWFADPFILDVTDDEIILLVEEYYKPIGKGRISKLRVARNTQKLLNCEVVLELPTHLSFPYIFRKDSIVEKYIKDLDQDTISSSDSYVYIMPENGESGHLYIYKYFPKTNNIRCLCSVLDHSVADAVPIEINNELFLFCTPGEKPNGKSLHIFKWFKKEKKFKFFKEVSFEENVARMSGDFFFYKDKCIRPTQECNIQYGHAVTLQEMNISNLSFKEIRRFYSVHPALNIGCHTFNMYKGVIVTDALGFDRIWIRKALKCFKII